ncbi:hypothetical protein ATE74_09780 [Sphingopyxis sp. H085]|nr:hypothetical protein ATE74_09780 [Sphingopyxis sp. H085]
MACVTLTRALGPSARTLDVPPKALPPSPPRPSSASPPSPPSAVESRLIASVPASKSSTIACAMPP